MKAAAQPAPVFQVLDAKGNQAEAGDLQSAIHKLIGAGHSLVGATINVYAPSDRYAVDLTPYTTARLAQLGFTLLRLKPPREVAP